MVYCVEGVKMELSVITPRISKSAVEYAKGLLERCESGEVIAVTAIEEMPVGYTCIVGSTIPNKFETAGMLLEAAMVRLNRA